MAEARGILWVRELLRMSIHTMTNLADMEQLGGKTAQKAVTYLHGLGGAVGVCSGGVCCSPGGGQVSDYCNGIVRCYFCKCKHPIHHATQIMS